MLHLKMTRDLPAPVDAAYAWLTDFEEADAQRAGALITKRRVLERTPTRILMEGEHRAFGRLIPSRYEVTLAPPDAWTNRVIGGPRKGSWTTYKLRPNGAAASRLELDYAITHESAGARLLLGVARSRVRRDIERMWEGYERAMQAEIPSPSP